MTCLNAGVWQRHLLRPATRCPRSTSFEFVSADGLISYGTTVVDTYRPLGVSTG
jgi:hypothetical protein